MNKLVTLSAVAIALIAGQAHAADLRVASQAKSVVRVSVAGKSTVQLDGEITAAARSVCGAQRLTARGEAFNVCVAESRRDANQQLAKIVGPAASRAKLLVSREDKSVIRVAVAGKSSDQLDREIAAAAETVCKTSVRSTVGPAYRACVSGAMKDAKAQLREIASARPQLLASL